MSRSLASPLQDSSSEERDMSKMPRIAITLALLLIGGLWPACNGQSPSTPAPAPAPPPASPPNQPPEAVGIIEDLRLATTDSAAVVDVSERFSDPDGDTLTYEAASGEESVATVSISESEVSVTPVARGGATITVTAKDPDGLNATQEFAVAVLEEGRIVYVYVEDEEEGLGDLGADEFLDGLPSELAEAKAEFQELARLFGEFAAESSFLSSGALACSAFDTYSEVIRDGADAYTAFEAAIETSLVEVLGYLLEIAVILETEDPDFSGIDADGFAGALKDFNSELAALLRYVRETKGRIEEEHCALFRDEARVLWDGEERMLSVTFGEETIDGQVIPVWGSPDAGKPLRTLQERKWWIAKEATSFSAVDASSRLVPALARIPWPDS